MAFSDLDFDHCTRVMPSITSWQYVIGIHGACVVLGGIPCALLLYRWRKTTQNTTTNPNPNAAPNLCLLVGTVAACSILVLRPAIEELAPDDRIVFFGPFVSSCFGFSTFFKACNAGMGDYPEGADRNLMTWLLWVTMLPEPRFEKGNTANAPWPEVRAKILDTCGKICIIFVLVTILLPMGPMYNLFGAPSESGWLAHQLADHANGFVHIWLLYAFASFCLDFSTLIDVVLSGGLRMNPGFQNPLLASRSLTEVWGTRWNKPVNTLLKRTIYVPLLRSKLCGPSAAAVLTFVGSGLLHEYNFWIHNHKAITAGVYLPGQVTGFFLVMGGLMVAESWVWHRCLPGGLQDLLRRLPSVVTASLLLFLVSGLAERHFLRSWFASGFLECITKMMPHLDCGVGAI